MKVLYIGNFEPQWSTEQDVKAAFEYDNHQVIAVQENKIKEYLHLIKRYDYDLLLITGTWADSITLEDWLDIVKTCATKGIPTATLHLDTFWGKSRAGRTWWREPMFHTAYIFTADGDYQKEWKLYGKNHIWLPPAVRHSAAHFGTFKEEYACDVAFVGSNGDGYHTDVWTYRKELVDYIRLMCQRHGWIFRNPGGDEPKIARGEQMNDFYASAKVTIGDSLCLKKENSHYWSDRVPEATGRGGLLIMPNIKAIKEIYPTMPTYEWGNFNQLENITTELLKNEEKRTAIVEETQKITAANHTYVNRIRQIIKEVGL